MGLKSERSTRRSFARFPALASGARGWHEICAKHRANTRLNLGLSPDQRAAPPGATLYQVLLRSSTPNIWCHPLDSAPVNMPYCNQWGTPSLLAQAHLPSSGAARQQQPVI